MWPFKKRTPESPEEAQALANLDEATFEVSADELQKEADREVSTAFNPEFEAGLGVPGVDAVLGHRRPFHSEEGDPVPEPVDDEDPAGGPSMRDVLDGVPVDDSDGEKN